MRHMQIAVAIVSTLAFATPAFAGAGEKGHGHADFSAGRPGDPKKPARILQVVAREGDGKMEFIPARLEIRRGEQISFKVRNSGALEHEFVLATTAENLKHAKQMMKNPEMEHDDPNAMRIEPSKINELVWQFTKAGTYEYGCLIPGHREAGMTGIIVVKK